MSAPCPIIHVYGSATAPETHRWMAVFFRPTVPTDAQEARGLLPGEAQLPMRFFASEKDTARAAAEAWWSAEQDRIAGKAAGFAARAAAAKARGKKAQVAA